MVNKVSTKDKLTAHALSAGSSIVGVLPSVDRFIGNSKNGLQIPLRWKALHPRNIARDFDWIEFDPAQGSGITPNNYKQFGEFSVDADKLKDAKEATGAIDAVSYRLGTMAMVGYRRDGGNIFVPDEVDPSRLAINMRIGKGPLIAAIGSYSMDAGVFFPQHDALTQGGVVNAAENQQRFV